MTFLGGASEWCTYDPAKAAWAERLIRAQGEHAMRPEAKTPNSPGVVRGFAVLIGAILAGPAGAETVENFYQGKNIYLFVGNPPGGGYDTYARLVARFMGAHIPGRPLIVVRNMPGAGSRTAAGHVYNVATRDGLSLGAVEPALPLEQSVGDKSILFDTSKFNWIGSPNSDNKVVVTWYSSGVKTVEDAKKQEVLMGATADTPSSQYVNAMNTLIGTKFKIIYGYPGGNEINIAMERGEVAGRGSSSWATWKARPELLRDHKINVLVQVGFLQAAELPDVPLLMDLAQDRDSKAALRLLSAPTAIGHPIFTSPEVPIERVNALRAAFDATMKDPAFLAEGKRTKLDVQATSGRELEVIVANILSAPASIKAGVMPLVLHRKRL
jgi:tripartite-type tricarboxylate transporter receptor subunit TctC